MSWAKRTTAWIGMGLVIVTATTLVLMLAIPATDSVIIEDFEDDPPGTVIAGPLPGGGYVPGHLSPYFTLQGTNHGEGPDALVIFDSSNPTGRDADLGTPNQSFMGPGIGAGGAQGQPGENAVPLGNVLIIPKNTRDADPEDGRVDSPDDESDGGKIRVDFERPFVVESVLILDIDEQTGATFTLYNGSQVVGTTQASSYGANSVEAVELSAFGAVTRVDIELDGDGAIDNLAFRVPPSLTNLITWGRVKDLFR